jgi:HK97 family phage prohead protease
MAKRPTATRRLAPEPVRKFVAGAVVADGALGERQIRVVATDATPDRMGEIVEPKGCIVANYRNNPVVLADHDSTFPIGTAEVLVTDARVEALITFAPVGAAAKADEYCALAKSGVLRAVSIGFLPVESQPMDPRKPYGAQRYRSWELLELSVVAVPANPSATVIARAARRGSRMAKKTAPKLTRKGLYEVGWLARILADLGYLEDCVEFEEAIEEDGSQVSAQLLAAMAQLGQVLLAMTAEEVAELIGDTGADDAGGADAPGMTAVIESFKSLSVADVVANFKAGRVLSAANCAKLKDAIGHHDKGMALIADVLASAEGGDLSADPEKGLLAFAEKVLAKHGKAAVSVERLEGIERAAKQERLRQKRERDLALVRARSGLTAR